VRGRRSGCLLPWIDITVNVTFQFGLDMRHWNASSHERSDSLLSLVSLSFFNDFDFFQQRRSMDSATTNPTTIAQVDGRTQAEGLGAESNLDNKREPQFPTQSDADRKP